MLLQTNLVVFNVLKKLNISFSTIYHQPIVDLFALVTKVDRTLSSVLSLLSCDMLKLEFS